MSIGQRAGEKANLFLMKLVPGTDEFTSMTRQPDNTILLIYWFEGPDRTYMNLHWEGKTKQLKRSSPGYGKLKKVLPLLECDYRSYLCGEVVRMYRLTWGEYRSIVDM